MQIRIKHVYKCDSVLNEFPLKHAGLAIRSRLTDGPANEHPSHLELWAGFPLLFEIRKCFETVQQQVDTASARLLCVRSCFCVARIMRAREGGAEVRIWRVLLWRLFSLGYSLVREFNGGVRHYHSMKHNNSGQQLHTTVCKQRHSVFVKVYPVPAER